MTTPIWAIAPSVHPQVVDLSHNNAGFTTQAEFTALRAAGVTDVIHKITEGVDFVDTTYHARRLLAVAAGLGWSAYHFCTNDVIEAQQDHLLKVLGDLKGIRWVALDAEQNRGATVDPAQAAALAINLDGHLRAALADKDAQALRYGNASVSEFRQIGWHDGPLWWAKYGPEPTVELMRSMRLDPARVMLWQATATGHVAGRGPLDLSYLRPQHAA